MSVVKETVIAIKIAVPESVKVVMLKSEVMTIVKETAVLMKCEGRTKSKVPANSRSHPECRTGTVSNEPTTKTATVEPTAARGRVR